MVNLEDIRLGSVVVFRGESDREGDINRGVVNGTVCAMGDGTYWVPVWIASLANGQEGMCMVICSKNIVEIRK